MVDLDALAKELTEAGFVVELFDGALMVQNKGRVAPLLDVFRHGAVAFYEGYANPDHWTALGIIARHIEGQGR